MRSYLPDFTLRVPKNLKEALHLLSAEPGVWRAFAGGTDLMVLLESGKLGTKQFLNLWNLSELKKIEVEPLRIRLGALTTFAEIQRHPILQKEFPLLCQAASLTGSPAIQNRGTLGGNIANASPAADSPPALLVYEAVLELVSAKGSRRIPYSQFHLGYKKMDLRGDELIGAIELPRESEKMKHYYRKVGPRKMQAIYKICFAGVGRTNSGKVEAVRIALGSVAPVPLRCSQTENAIRGQRLTFDIVAQAKLVIAGEIAPIDDIRSTARYRRRVAQNLLGEFLESL